MGGTCLDRVRARMCLFFFFFVFREGDEPKQSLRILTPNARLPLPPSTIHPLRTFLISRHAPPPTASAPRPPPFAPCALALATKRAGHASCQLDGAPSLRCFASSKSSSASTVTPAVPCFASFRSTRTCGGTRGTTSTPTTGTAACR